MTGGETVSHAARPDSTPSCEGGGKRPTLSVARNCKEVLVPNEGQASASDARIDGAPRQKLRLLDLFSGIGGFSLGLERTGGFETARFCEISPTCRHLLTHHWPEVPCHDDVRTLRGEDCGEVDAICGGFPCQDISLAGKGAGLAGERSGLWSHYARLVGEIRPRFVIVENVSALLVRGLGTVLGDLAALGYGAWWDCIPASAVGAPHRRDRLWIVAYAGSLEHQGFGDAFRRALAAELSEAALADACGHGYGPDDRSGEDRSAAPVGEGEGHQRQRLRALAGRGGAALADATGHGRHPWRPGDPSQGPQRGQPDRGGERGHVAYADEPGLEVFEHGKAGQQPPALRTHGWAFEPDIRRVAHGVPARVDRLHGLGNAVVPEIPYRIGRAILAADGALLRQDETSQPLCMTTNEAA